jgi:hypothetical protein
MLGAFFSIGNLNILGEVFRESSFWAEAFSLSYFKSSVDKLRSLFSLFYVFALIIVQLATIIYSRFPRLSSIILLLVFWGQFIKRLKFFLMFFLSSYFLIAFRLG